MPTALTDLGSTFPAAEAAGYCQSPALRAEFGEFIAVLGGNSSSHAHTLGRINSLTGRGPKGPFHGTRGECLATAREIGEMQGSFGRAQSHSLLRAPSG